MKYKTHSQEETFLYYHLLLMMPALGDLNERAISLEEVGEAVNEMKSGKGPGLDGFPVECLNKGGMAVLEWLVRLLNLSFDMGIVPKDWRGAWIVPLYNGKDDKCECSNSRGISLLSVVYKLFGTELGPELTVQQGRSNVSLGRVEDEWTKCLL